MDAAVDPTVDLQVRSFVDVPADSHFPLQNLAGHAVPARITS